MNHRPATTPIHEIMTHAPVTVTTHTTVGDLMTLFDRHDFNAFPVVDEHSALRGIVSKRDVLRLFRPDASFRIPDFATISSVRVGDFMRPGVITVEPEDPLVAAADLMVETRLWSLPVVQRRGGVAVLVGVVSQGDLLRRLRFEMVEELEATQR